MIEPKKARAKDLGSWLVASQIANRLGPEFNLTWEAFAGMYDELVFRAPPNEWVSLNRNGRLHAQRPDGERIALTDADVWTRVAAGKSNAETIAEVVAAVVGVYDVQPLSCARSVALIAAILQRGQDNKRRYRAESLLTASVNGMTFPTVGDSTQLSRDLRSQAFLISDGTTPLTVVDLGGPVHSACVSSDLFESCQDHEIDVRGPEFARLSALELLDLVLAVPACRAAKA